MFPSVSPPSSSLCTDATVAGLRANESPFGLASFVDCSASLGSRLSRGAFRCTGVLVRSYERERDDRADGGDPRGDEERALEARP